MYVVGTKIILEVLSPLNTTHSAIVTISPPPTTWPLPQALRAPVSTAPRWHYNRTLDIKGDVHGTSEVLVDGTGTPHVQVPPLLVEERGGKTDLTDDSFGALQRLKCLCQGYFEHSPCRGACFS